MRTLITNNKDYIILQLGSFYYLVNKKDEAAIRTEYGKMPYDQITQGYTVFNYYIKKVYPNFIYPGSNDYIEFLYDDFEKEREKFNRIQLARKMK